MINPGLDAIGVSAPFEIKVFGYELILARMLANQRRLPRQILRHQASLNSAKADEMLALIEPFTDGSRPSR